MDKIRVGVIGCGGIARNRHIPAFAAQPDVELVGMCDVDENCINMVAEKWDIPHVFTDYNDLLKLDELDAVTICTPNYLHMEPTVAALEAGKHVIVEKPIARNADEARKMVDAARKSGKKLMVAQVYRFRADSQALKRFVDAGNMGEIYYARVHALRTRGIPSWGVFIDKEKQGGGPLVDIGVHMLDTALWLMGHPKPISASAVTYAKFGHRSGVFQLWGQWDNEKFNVEDFAAGFIRFENGATLTIESSFMANIEKNSMSYAILGTTGGIQNEPLKMFRDEDGHLMEITPMIVPDLNPYEGEIRAFLDSIKNDTDPPVTGEQALDVIKILDAIYKSSEKGTEVTID